jgi:signal transduction histidine kinase
MENLSQAVHVLPQPTSLNKVVLDLIDLYQPAFTLKRLGSGLDLDPSLPLAWIDGPQLERGLANLLRSAVKHTRDGDLIVCRTTKDGDWVELTIGDSGPRISDERAARLFETGEDAGESPDARRNQLGLDLSQAIVAAHGGEIMLDTSHDTGAWFVVRLPAMALENARLAAQLERNMRLRYDLLARLSYELRTPLNVIMGYNDLLLDGAFGEIAFEQARVLRRMDRSARELLEIVNDALDPARHTHDGTEASPDAAASDSPAVASSGRAAERAATLATLARENARLISELALRRHAETEFLTDTSHRLRTPLTALIGYNDLLLDGEFGAVGSEPVQVLRRMRKSALELLWAVDTNLDSSRLDSSGH